MEITISSPVNAFFFVQDISLTKNGPSVTVDLGKVDDGVKVSICRAIAYGAIESSATAQDLVDSIADPEMRRAMDIEINDSNPGAIYSTEDAVTEIIEVETEPEQSDSVAETDIPDDSPETQATEEPVDATATLSKSVLKTLLKGNAKDVADRLKSAVLSEEDKLALVDIENGDKKRVTVVNLIQSL